jgi:hypothetical protein
VIIPAKDEHGCDSGSERLDKHDVEKFCWYCLICYAPMDMNLNYAIFVDFFPLCKKYYLFVMHCQNYYLYLYFKIIFRRFLLAYNRIFFLWVSTVFSTPYLFLDTAATSTRKCT